MEDTNPKEIKNLRFLRNIAETEHQPIVERPLEVNIRPKAAEPKTNVKVSHVENARVAVPAGNLLYRYSIPFSKWLLGIL
jgi:hypothetical protein